MMFSQETKRVIAEAQNGYCANYKCFNKIHSIHHKLHDTKYNREKFPCFINSIFNAVGLCESCHKNKQHLFRVTEKMAEIYEIFLEHLGRFGKLKGVK